MSFNFAAPTLRRYVVRAFSQLRLAPDDLLRDATYRRLWTSILISSFGGQVTMLAVDGGRVVARDADSNGFADGDGSRAVRFVFAAFRCMA